MELQVNAELERNLSILKLLRIFPEKITIDKNSLNLMRVIFETTKFSKNLRSPLGLQLLYDAQIDFETYQAIYKHILASKDRQALVEWIKFCFQMRMEDETLRS